MRAYRLAIIDDFQYPVGAFFRVDVEMVAPEIYQHFLQLPLRLDRAHYFRSLQLAQRP